MPSATNISVSVDTANSEQGVVAAAGELDLSCVEHFADELATAEAAGQQRLVLDLRDLTFIDSSGLGELVRCHRRMEEAGRELVLQPSEPVERLLGITGLKRVFSIDRAALSEAA